MTTKIVIAGAGPAGLHLAIELMLRAQAEGKGKELEIYMYEKYDTYQREHTLKVQNASFAQAHKHLKLQKVLNELLEAEKEISHIKTTSIEEKFNLVARELGVKIYKGQPVTSCEELMQMHPDAKVFIGADGSHSLVSKEVFNACDFIFDPEFSKSNPHTSRELPTHTVNDLEEVKHAYILGKDGLYYVDKVRKVGEKLAIKSPQSEEEREKLHALCEQIQAINSTPHTAVWLKQRDIEKIHQLTGHVLPSLDKSVNQTLQYAVQVKYKVQGPTKNLHMLTQQPLVQFQYPNVSLESVGRPDENGKTPVTLFFILDKQNKIMHETMRHATFSKPYTTEDSDKLPKQLHRAIFAWFAAREIMAGENRIHGDNPKDNERITHVHLNSYTSKHYTQTKNGKQFMKIGDAAMGTPFFDSYNTHVKIIPTCANAIYDYAMNDNFEAIATYERAMHNHASGMQMRAFVNNTKAVIGSSTAKVAHSMHTTSHKVAVKTGTDVLALYENNGVFNTLMDLYDAEIKNGQRPGLHKEGMTNLISQAKQNYKQKKIDSSYTKVQNNFSSTRSYKDLEETSQSSKERGELNFSVWPSWLSLRSLGKTTTPPNAESERKPEPK